VAITARLKRRTEPSSDAGTNGRLPAQSLAGGRRQERDHLPLQQSRDLVLHGAAWARLVTALQGLVFRSRLER
jgi:hypothetical protein